MTRSISTPDAGIWSGDRFVARDVVLERARRAATGLQSLGFKSGDGLALFLRNDMAMIEASVAAGMIGGYPVPINWHAADSEAAFVVEDIGAKVALVHADLRAMYAAALAKVETVIVVPTPKEIAEAYRLADDVNAWPAGAIVWGEWLARFDPIDAGSPPAPDAIIYTSGTTGRPKGIKKFPLEAHRRPGFDQQLRVVFGIEPGVRTIIPGPMYHAATNFTAIQSFREGGLVVLQPRFDAELLLAQIERFRIESMHLVPIMFTRLLRLPAETRAKYDLSSLRHVVHAAAPCPPAIKQAMIEWWGPIIYEYYGVSEAGPSAFCTSEEWLANHGTVGKVYPGCTVEVRGEDGAPVPKGEIGSVFILNPHFPRTRFHNIPDGPSQIVPDKPVDTGDLGTFNERGFLFVVDRKKDMLISGGVNIYPGEIERYLSAMPDVRDCVVFGTPDDEFGEAVTAVVELERDGAVSAEQIRTYVRERLGSHLMPSHIVFRQDLPREDSGKIRKRLIRDEFWGGAGRRI